MPPKARFSEKDIIDQAFKIVREQGIEKLSARSIAKALNASTGPVYSYLKSMEKIKTQLLHRTFDLLEEYRTRKMSGQPLIDKWIGYVMFAKEERYLWRFAISENNTEVVSDQFRKVMEEVDNYVAHETEEKVIEKNRRLFYITWSFTRGLAHILNQTDNELVLQAFGSDTDIVRLVEEGVEIIWKK